MDHKELCCSWVEERKFEDDEGKWWYAEYDTCTKTDKMIEGPFESEDAINDYLWPLAIECAHEDLIP